MGRQQRGTQSERYLPCRGDRKGRRLGGERRGWLEGTGEELGTEARKVVMDGIEFGFCVKIVNGTHLHTAGGYAEGSVLDTLEFLDGGGGDVGEPDSGVVGEGERDEEFVCEDKGLLALAQGGNAKGF